MIFLRTAKAQVIHISGCRDDQTSADAYIDGENVGAMSNALLTVFEQQANAASLSYTDLIVKMRQVLQGKYKQVPMLSTGYDLDLNKETFSI